MQSEGVGGRARTVGRQEKERPRASLAPADLVDTLLDLKALKIVELWLVALELTIEAVLNVLRARSKGVAWGRAMVLCSSLQGLQASAPTPNLALPGEGGGASHR